MPAVADNLAVMTKKVASDRHKPSRTVRIREPLAVQAELLAERLAHDLTQVVNDAVREKLERESLWPPQPPPARRARGKDD